MLVSGTKSCADKLGGGRDSDTVQQTAERCEDDGDGKGVGLRMPLLAAVVMAARALPPQTNRRRMTKQKSSGAKILPTLRRVRMRSSIVSF